MSLDPLPFVIDRFLWLPGDVGILEVTGDLAVPSWLVPYADARLHIDGDAYACVLRTCSDGPVGRRGTLWGLRFATPCGFDPTTATGFEFELPRYAPLRLPAPEVTGLDRHHPRVPRALRTALVAASVATLTAGAASGAAAQDAAMGDDACVTVVAPEHPCSSETETETPPASERPAADPLVETPPLTPSPAPPPPEPPAPPPATDPGPVSPSPSDEPDGTPDTPQETPKEVDPSPATTPAQESEAPGPPTEPMTTLAAVVPPAAVSVAAPSPTTVRLPAGPRPTSKTGRDRDGRRGDGSSGPSRRGDTNAVRRDRTRAKTPAKSRIESPALARERRAGPSPTTGSRGGALVADAPTDFVLPNAAYGDEPDIPAFLLPIYHKAARRYDIPWSILAAINEIETDFGRNVAVSSAGARGWMQFMPATWKAFGVDADKDGERNFDDPEDAIHAAARYLDASGGRDDLRKALFAYNHANWYVEAVLLRAAKISQMNGHSPNIDKLLEESDRRLRRRVLNDERITIHECGRQDVLTQRIDRRVLLTLLYLAESDLHPTVSSLRCGRGLYTASGNVSHHSSGDAVDIAAINGVPIIGNQGAGSVTDIAVRHLLRLRGALVPAQIITLMTYPDAPNTLAMGDHADHIHVGFRPARDTPSPDR